VTSLGELHRRVAKARGRPAKCERCGATDSSLRYEWANLTGNYEDISDYERMCRTCHKRYDAGRPPGRKDPPSQPRTNPTKTKRYTTTADYLSMMRRMMAAAGRRVGEADAAELAELIAIRDEMNAVIQRAVDGLRADGYTWESIGAATGTTRQAALMKWGPTAKARREV
jgi:hypothetical protein